MATILNSVRVGGFIAPSDSTDTYAVTDEMYNRGGYRSVADATARLAITPDRRIEGMLIKQLSDGTFWTLSGGILDTHFQVVVFGTASPLTTKGDLYTFSTVNTRLPIGINGYILTADSTKALGMEWKANINPTSFGTTTQIPFTNVAGTDFSYSDDLIFNSTTKTLSSVNFYFNGTLTTPALSITGSTIQFLKQASCFIHGTTGNLANGQILVISGGSGGVGNYNGGDLKLQGGSLSGTGTAGKIYLGSGSSGNYALATAVTSNVVYYNTSTGQITYGAIASGSKWTATGSDIYYNTGSVGIGTTNPYKLLHLYGTEPTITLQSSTSPYDHWIIKSRDADQRFSIGNDDSGYGGEMFTILRTGNIGIGTTSPSNLLSLKTPNGTIARLSIKGGENNVTAVGQIHSSIDLEQNDDSLTDNIAGRIAAVSEYANGAWTGMAFYTGKAGRTPVLQEAMRINTDGNVGIGIVSPSVKLHVAGDITSSQYITCSTYFISSTSDLVAGTTSSGYVYIRPTKYDSATGQSYFTVTSATIGTPLNVTGAIVASSTMTATNFILSSDRRLKTNIVGINKRPVDVEYKQFEMKSEPDQLRYGVIAQDLQVDHPELVRTDEKGVLSVAYIDLFVKEIAMLKDEIKKLERKLA